MWWNKLTQIKFFAVCFHLYMPFLDLFKAETIIHAVSSLEAFYEKQNYGKYAVISFNFRRLILFVLKRYYLIINYILSQISSS